MIDLMLFDHLVIEEYGFPISKEIILKIMTSFDPVYKPRSI